MCVTNRQDITLAVTVTLNLNACKRGGNERKVKDCLSEPFTKQVLVFTFCNRSLEHNVGKGKTARNDKFLLLPKRFLPFWRTLPFSSNLKLTSANSFSLEESKIFVWKRVNFHGLF